MVQVMGYKGKCKLCRRDRELLMSHVIPRFTRKRAKATSVVDNPRFYTAEGGEFRKLEQDLPKRTWLCHACEQLLSQSEKRFAEDVYQRVMTGQAVSVKSHDEYVHKFLVSMAWRTWHWYHEQKDNSFSKALNLDRLSEAEDVWRAYLLGTRSDVGEFKQHMLFQTGPAADPSGRAVGMHGYYWARGSNLDILGVGGTRETILMCYSKIPKIAMFGIVEKEMSGDWTGTLVEPGSGDTWSSQKAIVPKQLSQYFREQSEKLLGTLDGVPEAVKRKTRQRMDTLIKNEGDDYLKRDAVRSMISDDLMQLPDDSFVSDAIGWAAKSSDPRARKFVDLLGRLTDSEMRSLHKATNRIGIRCKALSLEERFSLLADGREEASEPGTAILVGVEVFRTQERAMERSQLPLFFGVDSEEVTVAIGAEVVPVRQGNMARGIRYVE